MTCERVQAVATSTVHREPGNPALSDDDIDEAYHHLKRCASCRRTLDPALRGQFVTFVVLDRD